MIKSIISCKRITTCQSILQGSTLLPIAAEKSHGNVHNLIADILLKCTPPAGVYLISHGLFFFSTLRNETSFDISLFSSSMVKYFS
jgi:hypothetical protein